MMYGHSLVKSNYSILYDTNFSVFGYYTKIASTGDPLIGGIIATITISPLPQQVHR